MPVDRCIKNKGPTAILTTTKTTTRKTRNEDGDNDEEKNVGRQKRKKEEGKRTRKIKSGGLTRATTAVTSNATKIVQSPRWRRDSQRTKREGR